MTTLLDALHDIGGEVDDEFDDTLPHPPEHAHGDDERMALISFKGVSSSEWGPRWPDCAAGNQRRATGGGVSVNIHKELAVITAGLLAVDREEFGYVLKQDQTGAFVCRPIGGTRTASNHSICTAIDKNWRENEFSTTPRYTLPAAVIRKWKQYGWSWGGDWSGKKDTMHFEWVRSIAEARRYTALFLNDHSSKTVPTTPPPTPDKVLPMFNPPHVLQPIVDEALAPEGGVILLGLDGSIYAYGGAMWFQGMNNSTHFAGRRAARLEYVGNRATPAAPRRWRITAHTGETYHLPTG